MCAHGVSGHGIGCQAIRTPHIFIYSDKHTSTCEAIQISPPNLSEGGSLRSPIRISYTIEFHFWKLSANFSCTCRLSTVLVASLLHSSVINATQLYNLY